MDLDSNVDDIPSDSGDESESTDDDMSDGSHSKKQSKKRDNHAARARNQTKQLNAVKKYLLEKHEGTEFPSLKTFNSLVKHGLSCMLPCNAAVRVDLSPYKYGWKVYSSKKYTVPFYATFKEEHELENRIVPKNVKQEYVAQQLKQQQDLIEAKERAKKIEEERRKTQGVVNDVVRLNRLREVTIAILTVFEDKPCPSFDDFDDMVYDGVRNGDGAIVEEIHGLYEIPQSMIKEVYERDILSKKNQAGHLVASSPEESLESRLQKRMILVADVCYEKDMLSSLTGSTFQEFCRKGIKGTEGTLVKSCRNIVHEAIELEICCNFLGDYRRRIASQTLSSSIENGEAKASARGKSRRKVSNDNSVDVVDSCSASLKPNETCNGRFSDAKLDTSQNSVMSGEGLSFGNGVCLDPIPISAVDGEDCKAPPIDVGKE